jgi:hypothetical protein
VADRLGGQPADSEKVKDHEFFAGFDWAAALECSSPPPFIPRYKCSIFIQLFDTGDILIFTRNITTNKYLF